MGAVPADCSPHLHAVFLDILPRIELHGRVYFRHVRDAGRKEECIAEMVALAWAWCVRLSMRGRDVRRFPSAIATFAARAVHSGRRLCGQEKGKDVLSPLAQRTHGFTVGRLPDFGALSDDPLAEALMENGETPVPDQVSFRMDFPRWRQTRCRRDRDMIDRMMLGERTLDLSNQFGISPGRVSQKRREFHGDWRRFHGEPTSLPV